MHDKRKFPKINELAVAILEEQIKKIIGESAVDIIKEPYLSLESKQAVSELLERVEIRFIKSFDDQEIIEAIEALPLKNLPSLIADVHNLHSTSTENDIHYSIQKNIENILPKNIQQERILIATSTYTKLLWEELINLPVVRNKLTAHSTFAIEEHVQGIYNTLSKIEKTLSSALNQQKKELRNGPKIELLQKETLDKPITIGKAIATDDIVQIPIAQLRKHTVIIGKSGIGKTYAITNLLHCLWEKYQISFINLDPRCRSYYRLNSNHLFLKEHVEHIMEVFQWGTLDYQRSGTSVTVDELSSLIQHFNKVNLDKSQITNDLQFIIVLESFQRFFKAGTSYYDHDNNNRERVRKITDLMLRARESGIGFIFATQTSYSTNVELIINSRNFYIFSTLHEGEAEPFSSINALTQEHLKASYYLKTGEALFYSAILTSPALLKTPVIEEDNVFY